MLRIARAVNRAALANGKSVVFIDATKSTVESQAWKDMRRMTSSLPKGAIIIPMPQLSPHMTSGIVAQWLKQPGEEISTYDIIFECETDNMSEDAYKVGDFAGAVTMLVEAQDEGHLAKILVAEGERVDVGTPVGLMCEDAEDLAAIQGFQGPIPSGQGLDGPRTLTWQAYLKSGTGRGEGCL